MRIPRVFAELSTRRILVSELVGGEELAPFAARASQAERDRAGELLFDFAYTSMFTHGLFNADPHPGNYLFGPGQVSFLDFGCVKRLEAEGVTHFKQLASLGAEADWRARLLDLVYEPGAPRPRPYSTEELALLLGP